MQDIFLWVVENRFFLMGGLIALAALDYAYDRTRRVNRSLRDLANNVAIFTVGQALHLLLIQEIPFQGMKYISQFALFRFPDDGLHFALALVTTDFLYYCWHRASHTVPLLWAEHCVHHSSDEFNFSTSIRLPWLNPLVIWIFFAPAILIGFSPEAIFLCMTIVIVGQFFVHNDHVPKLGWIEKVITTPSNHRVHHGYDAEYADRNFGGLLVIWDRLFGTYREEKSRPRYESDRPTKFTNPFSINFGPFAELFSRAIGEARNARAPLRFLRRLFIQPERERAMRGNVVRAAS